MDDYFGHNFNPSITGTWHNNAIWGTETSTSTLIGSQFTETSITGTDTAVSNRKVDGTGNITGTGIVYTGIH